MKIINKLDKYLKEQDEKKKKKKKEEDVSAKPRPNPKIEGDTGRARGIGGYAAGFLNTDTKSPDTPPIDEQVGSETLKRKEKSEEETKKRRTQQLKDRIDMALGKKEHVQDRLDRIRKKKKAVQGSEEV